MARSRLADRLERLDLTRQSFRPEAAEEALWRHLAAVGAETDNVRWEPNLARGFLAVRERLGWHDDRVWEPSSSGSWERQSLWRPDAPVSWPDYPLHQPGDPIGNPIAAAVRSSLGRGWRTRRRRRGIERYRLSVSTVPDPVSVFRLAAEAAHHDRVRSAPPPALEAIRAEELRSSNGREAEYRAERRYAEARRAHAAAEARLSVYAPLVRALAAGLGFFWVLERRGHRHRQVIAVLRPAVRVDDGRLHSWDGPAVSWRRRVPARWAHGAYEAASAPPLEQWFWRGISVPARLATRADRLTVADVASIGNVEVRRLAVERLGYERFLAEGGAELVQQDDFGRLWRTGITLHGEPVTVVEVVNATDEPDGSRRRYFLRVPPTAQSAREAVAWTFGFDNPAEYLPIAQS
jgi:hypothetical protein